MPELGLMTKAPSLLLACYSAYSGVHTGIRQARFMMEWNVVPGLCRGVLLLSPEWLMNGPLWESYLGLCPQTASETSIHVPKRDENLSTLLLRQDQGTDPMNPTTGLDQECRARLPSARLDRQKRPGECG